MLSSAPRDFTLADQIPSSLFTHLKWSDGWNGFSAHNPYVFRALCLISSFRRRYSVQNYGSVADFIAARNPSRLPAPQQSPVSLDGQPRQDYPVFSEMTRPNELHLANRWRTHEYALQLNFGWLHRILYTNVHCEHLWTVCQGWKLWKLVKSSKTSIENPEEPFGFRWGEIPSFWWRYKSRWTT